MFISISATSLNGYEWYKYEGARASHFKSHHSKHDLELSKGDRFGLKKYGTSYKLIDLSEVKVKFTLTEKEVKRLLKKSVGARAIYKGLRLPAGKGIEPTRKPRTATKPAPAKVRRRARPESEEKTARDPKYFPNVPFPPKKADVARLYTYFNKLLFNNECPKKVIFQITDTAKRSGQASATKYGEGNVEYKLRLAKRSLTDVMRYFDIVLHEMIHLRHMRMYFELNDERYEDASHGPLFVQDMERVNQHGYNVVLRETSETKPVANLLAPEHILIVHRKLDIIWFYHKDDFRDKIDTILAKMYKMSSDMNAMTAYKYGTTDSTELYLGNMLSRNQTLPKNRKITRVSTKIAKRVDESVDVEIHETLTERLSKDDGVRPGLIASVNDSPYIRTLIYKDFLYAALHLADEDVSSSATERQLESMLSPEELTYLREKWSDVPDPVLISSPYFDETRKRILLSRLDNEQACSVLANLHKVAFKGRLDASRFAELCIKAFGDIITMSDHDIEATIIDKIASVS